MQTNADLDCNLDLVNRHIFIKFLITPKKHSMVKLLEIRIYSLSRGKEFSNAHPLL